MIARVVIAIVIGASVLVCLGCATAQKRSVKSPTSQLLAGEAVEGTASFYADSLAGNQTASGEEYNPDDRTCAHRSLPFGTILSITAVSSGATSKCRVNDRGPYAKGRLIDVSKRCAMELGMVEPGVLRVRVRAVDIGGGDG